MSVTDSRDVFTIEQHGEVTVIVASSVLEQMNDVLLSQATPLVLAPLRNRLGPLAVFDLAPVDYFGSSFLGLMLRAWKLIATRGGQMALSGVSERVRALLRLTSLDFLWPIYDSRREAIEALLSD